MSRKYTASVLCVLVGVFVATGQGVLNTQDAEFIRGDVNGDGCVNAIDAEIILGLPQEEPGAVVCELLPCCEAADANDDGVIDRADAVYIQNFETGGPPPPWPFPRCGRDLDDFDDQDCREYPREICDQEPCHPDFGDLFIRGDGNGDGDVDLSDAIHILQALFLGGPSSTCKDAADANDDGNVDISDAIIVLEMLFSGGVELPFPYPTCGEDPTPEDELPPCDYPACPKQPR